MTVIGVALVVAAAAYVVTLLWTLRTGPPVHELVTSQLVTGRTANIEKAAEIDWSRLPHEITRAVEAADGPGVIVQQLTPGLGFAIDEDTDEAVIYEQGTGELVRLPMFRLREIDPVLLVEALDDPKADEAAARGDLLVEAPPNDSWIKAWVRGNESQHWGCHRSLAVPGWPWGEE